MLLKDPIHIFGTFVADNGTILQFTIMQSVSLFSRGLVSFLFCVIPLSGWAL